MKKLALDSNVHELQCQLDDKFDEIRRYEEEKQDSSKPNLYKNRQKKSRDFRDIYKKLNAGRRDP